MADDLDREIIATPPRRAGRLGRVVFTLITVGCFAYLYFRIDAAAAREGLTVVAYMAEVFRAVDWLGWIAVMATYSLFYFLIDTLVLSRALSWFIADIRYRDILPIRGSAYIISIFNEQVGKGAMAYYLNRRHRVPGWEVGSVMLFRSPDPALRVSIELIVAAVVTTVAVGMFLLDTTVSLDTESG